MRRGKKRKAAGTEPAAAVLPELPRELWTKIASHAVGDMHANCVNTLRLVNKQWAGEFMHTQLRFAIKKIFDGRQKERRETVVRGGAAYASGTISDRDWWSLISNAAGEDHGDLRMLRLAWNMATTMNVHGVGKTTTWRTHPLRLVLEALRATFA